MRTSTGDLRRIGHFDGSFAAERPIKQTLFRGKFALSRSSQPARTHPSREERSKEFERSEQAASSLHTE
jgi:hypothetical protein